MAWLRALPFLILLLVPATLAAQQSAPQPAFKIDGWSYQLRPGGVHAYACVGNCNRSSNVSYRLYPPDFKMPIETFRTQQAQVVKLLESRTPGLKIEIISIDEESYGKLRAVKSHRVHRAADGRQEHAISAFVFGASQPFSLISSADDEAAVKANYRQFLAPIALVVGIGAPPR